MQMKLEGNEDTQKEAKIGPYSASLHLPDLASTSFGHLGRVRSNFRVRLGELDFTSRKCVRRPTNTLHAELALKVP